MKQVRIAAVSVLMILSMTILLAGCSKSAEDYRKDITYKERVIFVPYQPTQEEIDNAKIVVKATWEGKGLDLIQQLNFETKIYSLDEIIDWVEKNNTKEFEFEIGSSSIGMIKHSDLETIDEVKEHLRIADKLFSRKNLTLTPLFPALVSYRKAIEFYISNKDTMLSQDKEFIEEEIRKISKPDYIKEIVYRAYECNLYHQKENLKAMYVLNHAKYEITYKEDINKVLENIENGYLAGVNDNKTQSQLFNRVNADENINRLLEAIKKM